MQGEENGANFGVERGRNTGESGKRGLFYLKYTTLCPSRSRTKNRMTFGAKKSLTNEKVGLRIKSQTNQTVEKKKTDRRALRESETVEFRLYPV